MNKHWLTAFVLTLLPSAAFAADRTIDLSGGCKVYQLQNKAWVEADSASMDGLGLAQNQILRDAAFTVFRTQAGTFGVNQRCVKAGVAGAAPAPMAAPGPMAAPARPTGRRRAAAPAPVRGDTHSPWSAVFSIGYNLGTTGNVKSTYAPVPQPDSTIKYTGTMAFMGEANYRVSSSFRLAGEIGLSQLQVDSAHGNETSFFDVRPELVFRGSPTIELYVGPMLGLFFLSQNAEPGVLSDGATALAYKQQSASAFLLGLSMGADYALNEQFDIGFFIRYFKPGGLKVTATVTDPADFSSTISVSYISTGFRFAIHF